MIRVTVSYPATEGARFDHAYYAQQHADLIRRLLTPHGLKAVQIDRALSDGAGQPAPVVAAAHLLFDSLDSYKAAMKAEGRALGADMPHYTDIKPVVLVSETA